MKIRRPSTDGSVKIDMTPMIDVVFQLLAFFLMTFKVAAVEGDFQSNFLVVRQFSQAAQRLSNPGSTE